MSAVPDLDWLCNWLNKVLHHQMVAVSIIVDVVAVKSVWCCKFEYTGSQTHLFNVELGTRLENL